jgi:hypothetical protein
MGHALLDKHAALPASAAMRQAADAGLEASQRRVGRFADPLAMAQSDRQELNIRSRPVKHVSRFLS